jgi:hypothetical protein
MNMLFSENSALMKQLRYRAVGQKTPSFADLGYPLRGQVSSP